MKMKKNLFILICIFALLLGGCANRQNTPLGHGLELIDELEFLVKSDEAVELYGITGAQYKAGIEALREVDFSELECVYKVTYDTRELLEQMLGREISDELFEVYEEKAAPSFASSINADESVESIVLSSCFSVGKGFECKKIEEDMMYFYVYDGAIVGVSFNDGEDDACHASATLVFNGDLVTSSVDDFEESLESIIGCVCDVEKVY